jgi:protein pelota
MKILKIDKKENEIQCIPETAEDLWHLEKILSKDDVVYGTVDRKIKPKKEGEKAERIKLFVELKIEEVHFEEYSSNLRINGIILSGKPEELIEIKSHQNLEVEIGEKIRIIKESLKQWEIDRLKKAEKSSATNGLLAVLLDDEEADIAIINSYDISKKANIKEKIKGKRYAQEKSTYFEEILEKILLLKPTKILLAGPGFTKDNLKKFIEDKKIKGIGKISTENTNSINATGFNELMKEGKIEKVEKELQLSKESKIIEEFMSLVSKGKGEYGTEKVKNAIEMGAVEKLILAETYLMQNRDNSEKILDMAEKAGSEIEIISSKNPQEKIIFGFGGIVAILRYKLE